MVFHQVIQRMHVLTSQRNLEIGLVSFRFLLYFFSEVVQIHDFTFLKFLVFQVP